MNIFDPKNSLEWRDYLKILRRRKWYLIGTFLLVLPIGALKIASDVPLYRSSCAIKVRPSTFQLLPASIKRTLPGVTQAGGIQAIRTQILSPHFIKKLMKKLDLDNDPKILEKAKIMNASLPEKELDEVVEIVVLKAVKKSFWVKSLGGEVIVISATTTSADISYSFAKTIAEIYMDESYKSVMRKVQNSINFNNEQLAVFRQKLGEADRNLEKFKRERFNSEIENPSLSKSSVQHFQKSIIAIRLATREKRDYIEYLEGKLQQGDDAEKFPQTETIQIIFSKIDDKIIEMASMMKRFSWKSPEVISVSRKINDFREEVKLEIEKLYKIKYADKKPQELGLLLELAISYADIDILNQKNTTLNETLATPSQGSSQQLVLKKLEQDVAANREIYNRFLKQNQGIQLEKTIAEADASDQFRILIPALLPEKPMNAGVNMILLVTLLAASGLGAGSIYLREFLDTSVRTVNEAEGYFGLPVIGVVPFLGIENEKTSRKWPFIVIGGIILLSSAGFALWYFKGFGFIGI